MTDYSLKMQEVFRLAQFEAARFESSYLESWHVLLAMVEIDSSVAGLSFAEFENDVQFEDYQTAAILAVGRSPKKPSGEITLLEQSNALSRTLSEAYAISQATHAKEVGTEHVLFAMLLNPNLLATRILELVGFQIKDDGESVRLLDLRKAVERYAGFSKEDIKAIFEMRKPKKNKNNSNFSDLMKPPSMTGELADFTRDLTDLARKGRLEPVIGREKEISRMIQILSRKTKIILS